MKTLISITQMALIALSLIVHPSCFPGETEPNEPSGDKKLTRKSQSTDLPGSWQLADIPNFEFRGVKSQVGELAPGLTKVFTASIIEAGVLYNFFPDSTFTEFTGSLYRHGKWRFDRSRKYIVLLDEDSRNPDTVHIQNHDAEFLTLRLHQDENLLDYKLRRLNDPLEAYNEDPFHPVNNTWRIRPNQPESNDKIRVRLINHILHNIALLDAAEKRKSRVVSWKFTPTFIQIYNGGIGLREEEGIDEAFYSAFYSKKEGQKAIAMYEKILSTPFSLGPGTGNWYVDDANLLRVVVNKLNKE